jgi:hypothetical protein
VIRMDVYQKIELSLRSNLSNGFFIVWIKSYENPVDITEIITSKISFSMS